MKANVRTVRTIVAIGVTLWLCGCSESQQPVESAPAVREDEAVITARFDRAMGPLADWLTIAETHPGTALATWKVKAGPEAPSPPNVLALTETRNRGSTYNLAIFKKPQFGDLDLSVKVRADKGEEDQGGGPIWRCRDENNYYICRFNPLEANFRVYKVVDAKRTQLATAETDAEAGKWHTIRIMMVGPQIECYLNGQKLLTAADDTIKEPGRIGFWTKADAATSFDDLTAREAASPTP
jgi:hypothetical protein